MNKKIGINYIVLAVMIVSLTACGSSGPSKTTNSPVPTVPSTTAPAAPGTAAPTGQIKNITVSAVNFEFDKKEIQVNKGDTIKLTFISKAGSHGFKIPDLGVDIKGNGTTEFTVKDAGTFPFNCSVLCGTGHDNMVGELIVK